MLSLILLVFFGLFVLLLFLKLRSVQINGKRLSFFSSLGIALFFPFLFVFGIFFGSLLFLFILGLIFLAFLLFLVFSLFGKVQIYRRKSHFESARVIHTVKKK